MAEETNMKVIKVKLIKGGEKLELTLQESGTVQSIDNKECKNPVHPDLSNAVQALAVHLAILCDFIEPKQSNDTEELKKFSISGYSIGGKEDEEGVIITGMRKTKTGQKYSINSPFTRFEGSDESRYILMGDLQTKLDAIEAEVREYLFNGKMAQPSLFSGNDNGEEKEPVTHLQFAGEQTEEEKQEEALNRLRQVGNGSQLYANPEAMKDVAELPNGPLGNQPDNGTGEGVSEWTEGERNKMRGRKRKTE